MTKPKPKTDVIAKVTKLLALADADSGATPAERENAQRRAADLMTRHQIAVMDLDDATQGAIRDDGDLVIEGMTEGWRGVLHGRIAAAMGGDWYYSATSRTRRRYHLIGRPETITFTRTLADHLIPWLEIECEAALQRAIDRDETGTCSRCDGAGETRRLKGGGYTETLHTCPTCAGTGIVPLNRRVFRREFYDAATRRIAGRLHAQRAKTANEVGGKGKSTDLVRSDKAAIEAFYEAGSYSFTSSSSTTTGGAAAGRADGRDAGSRADLKPASKVTKGRGALTAGAAA